MLSVRERLTALRPVGKWSVARAAISLGMLVVVAAGLYTSLFMNSVGRSFWVDEAMLASSFSKRSFIGILTGGEFEYLQSAPFGWIVFEKLLAKLFGNTEFVLRMGSFACLVGVVVVLCVLQRFHYRSAFPVSAAALLVTIPFVLCYSSEFKPYICDGLVALLACVAYALYLDKRIGAVPLALVWCALLWLSQPVCFVEGGLVLGNLVLSLLDGNKREAGRSFALGVAVCVGFALYYVLWVRRMTDVAAMRDWWKANDGYLALPTSIEGLGVSLGRVAELFTRLGVCWPVVLACVVCCAPVCVVRRDRMGSGIVCGLSVALFASCIGLYPLQDRLWFFCIPLVVLLCVTLIGNTVRGKEASELVIGFALLVLALCNTGIPHYLNAKNVHKGGEEYLPQVRYLEEHVGDGDMVYVYAQTRPGFEYTNGYDNHSVAGYDNNVVLGTTQFKNPLDRNKAEDQMKSYEKYKIDLNRFQEEIDLVMSYPRCYVVDSHSGEPGSSKDMLGGLASAMLSDGYLELVSYEHKTPLWYHCAKPEDRKTHGSIRLDSNKSDNTSALIEITNDGEAYLGNPYDELFLQRSDGLLIKLERLVAPGEKLKVRVPLLVGADTTYTLRYSSGCDVPGVEELTVS